MYRRVVAAILAASILTFASLAHAEVRPVVIGDDGGGNVATFVMWYKRLAESGVPVRVRGLCVSACTFVLMLPKSQVCVEPTASFGFHLATDGDDNADVPITAALIRRWYPESVRKWLVGKTLAERPIYMTAEEAVKLDVFPACDMTPGLPH